MYVVYIVIYVLLLKILKKNNQKLHKYYGDSTMKKLEV